MPSGGTREARGAKLLSSSTDYDPSAELPSDKNTKLIFYCANTRCSASDNAAEAARKAGYADVNIMRAGIEGWEKRVERPLRPPRAEDDGALPAGECALAIRLLR